MGNTRLSDKDLMNVLKIDSKMIKMKLVINGAIREFNCGNISELLNTLKLNKDAVAVELNKNIVHRQNFGNTRLKNNDRLEIVKAVGGG
jgi:sulfur carrier protein